jgi:hypothetical protein
MAELIYVSNVSLDGYIGDEHGSFDCTATDDELFCDRAPSLGLATRFWR